MTNHRLAIQIPGIDYVSLAAINAIADSAVDSTQPDVHARSWELNTLEAEALLPHLVVYCVLQQSMFPPWDGSTNTNTLIC